MSAISSVHHVEFRKEDFDVVLKDVEFGKNLGHGNFSEVFKGSYKGNAVAIKKQTIVDPDLEKYLLKELSVLKSIDHPHVIKFFGACRDESHADIAYILTEYVEGGDLRRLLQEQGTELGWKFRVQIARDCIEAIQFLHENDIIHRDVKTDNILLDKDGVPKLCDFGFARRIDRETQMTMCGTDEFMAPEILFCMPYDEKADIFSYGITLVELITRKIPGKEGSGFLERTPKDGFGVNFEELEKETKLAKSPESLEVLLKDVLADEASSRLSAKDVREWLDDLLNELSDDKIPKPVLTEEAISGKLEKYLKQEEQQSNSAEVGGGSRRSQTNGEKDRVLNALSQRDVDLRGLSDVGSEVMGSVASNNGAGENEQIGGKISSGRPSLIQKIFCCIKSKDKVGAAAAAAPDWERLAGWVTKRGGRVKSWKKRYMVITRLGVVYFKSQDDQTRQEAQGSIEFSEMIEIAGVVCNSVPVIMTGKKNSFVVHCMKRDYYMAADSEEEREKWIKALIDGYEAYTNSKKKKEKGRRKNAKGAAPSAKS